MKKTMSKSKSIRVHPKYGVNPTIPVCVWCGKERNEVAMLGAAYKEEAPMRMILDYEPCDDCKDKMKLGVAIIEASRTPVREGWPPFSTHGDRKVYITGRWVVVKPEAIHDLLKPSELAEKVIAGGSTLLDVEAFSRVFGEEKK